MPEYLREFVRILSKLVNFKTLAINHDECERAVLYLEEILREYGFRTEILRHPDGNPVILASVNGVSDKSLLFYNHYDVQPVEPLEEWKSDPFTLKEDNGFLYGRGVGDNKGNIVSRILAVKQVIEEEGKLPYGVKFVIEGEEEAGSPHLLEMLQQRKEFFRDVVGVIWEFGGFGRDDSIALILGLKGILYVELEAKRLKRDAHSSLAVILPSAAWDLIRFLYELKMDNLEQIKSFHEGIIDVKKIVHEIENEGYELAFDPNGLKEEFGIKEFINNLSGREALFAYFGNPTFNIDGFITGYTGPGSKTVLPAKASVKIDFRLVPNQDPMKIARELSEYAKKRDIECRIHSMTEPAYTDFRNPFIQKLIKILTKMGEKIRISPWSPASGPMHIFTKYFGLPAVAGIGVSYWGSRHHAPNENIRLKDVERTIRILKNILRNKDIVES